MENHSKEEENKDIQVSRENQLFEEQKTAVGKYNKNPLSQGKQRKRESI